LQQHFQFNSLGTFLWQFVNGNAAPHLWYNTMMLQFIILMPIFWLIAHLTENKPILSIIITITTVIFYLWWLYFYSTHASNGNNWYLLDRVFISFIIYGILGTLAWINHKVIEKYLPKFFLLLLL